MCSRTVWSLVAVATCLFALPTVAAAQADPPTVLPAQEIFAPEAPDGGIFGVSVAIDGRDLITSRSDFTAHAYRRDDTGVWRYIGQIPAPGAALAFGFVVDIDDGFALLYGLSNGGSTGNVFVFRRADSGWILQQTLTAPDGNFPSFGGQIVVHGRTAFIGGGPNEVYVFERDGNDRFVFRQSLRGEDFSSDIAFDGDVAIIGAANANTGPGHAVIFVRINGVWRKRQELVASDPQDRAQFGHAVALKGSTAVIISLFQNGTGNPFQVGQAYVFARTGGHWFETQRIPNDRVNALFGLDVAMVGEDRFAVTSETGAPQDATTRLFERGDGNWALSAILSADPGPSTVRALDVCGDTLVAADPDDAALQRLFIYELGARRCD